MTEVEWFEDDDAFLKELGKAIKASDDIPETMRRAALGAFTWRTVDADLENLLLSSESSVQTAGVRGRSAGSGRLVTFQGPTIGVELEIGGGTVTGQVFPVCEASITVLSAQGEFSAGDTDEMGYFEVPWPSSGPARVQCEVDSVRFITEWIRA